MGNLSAYQVSKHEDRAQKLLDKCTGVDTGSVVILNTGEEVKIYPSGNATRETADALKKFLNGEQEFRGTYRVNVSSSAGEYVVPISALAKTGEFGGGAGVAGGSDLTRVVEAGQCITCAQLQYGTGSFESHVSLGKGETIANIEAAKKQLDQSWKDAIAAIGESLAKKLPSGYWHWQDSFVKSIQVVYSGLEDRLPGTFDRYNPADIWYTDQPYEYITEVSKDVGAVSSLEELTEKLNTLYEEKKAVGISLKKTSCPEIKPYTGEQRNTVITLEDIEVGKRKPGTLYFDISFTHQGVKNLCQIRKDNFSYRATLKAVKDQSVDVANLDQHYDGSVGRGIIIHCLQKIYSGSPDIFEPSFYLEEENRNLADYILNHLSYFDQEDVKKAEELLEGFYPIQLSKEPETFRKGVFNTREMAVAHSLDAVSTVLREASDKARKEFLGRLVRFAWSIHTDSCNFLKVS